MSATRLILVLAALSAPILPAQDTPRPLDPTIAPPVVLYREPPVLPELARRHGIQGNVLLKIEITRSGEVANPRVLRSASYGFDEAAIASVSKWKFQPARKDGQPIPVELTLEVNFQVKTGASLSLIREIEEKARKREEFNRAIAAV